MLENWLVGEYNFGSPLFTVCGNDNTVKLIKQGK